VDYY
jgi:hypothetical protein